MATAAWLMSPAAHPPNRAHRRVLDELPLPLPPEAGNLQALAVAVALEDALGVTLDDMHITVDRLGSRDAVEALLRQIAAAH